LDAAPTTAGDEMTPAEQKAKRDAVHHQRMVSPKQLQRMASGRVESRISDYPTPHEEARRQGVIRRAIEDRMLAKALGLDYTEVA